MRYHSNFRSLEANFEIKRPVMEEISYGEYALL